MPAVNPNVHAFADRIMEMITEDIEAGVLPPGVNCFSDLHSYTDANTYLDWADVPFDTTRTVLDLNIAVTDEVTRRLRAPGRPHCGFGNCQFPHHDHTEPGPGEDRPTPMRCPGCGQNAHFDSKLNEHRHDDPATPDCSHIHTRGPADGAPPTSPTG